MLKLLFDVNLSPKWAEYCSANGFQAAHWCDLGKPADALDSEIFAYAREHGYCIVTHDLDFSAIHANLRQSSPSIIQLRLADIRPHSFGTPLLKLLNDHATSLRDGCILSIDTNKVRIRSLLS